MSAPIILKSADKIKYNDISVEFNRSGNLIPARSSLENGFLSALDQSTLISILPLMERVRVSRNEQIFCCEERVSSLFFPESCVISEYQILEDGRTLEVAMIGKEGALGLSSAFDHAPVANWSQVIIPGTALKLDLELLNEDPDVVTTLQQQCFNNLVKYIDHLTRRIVCHKFHSLERRFCSWLLMVHDRCSNSNLPLTQDQIARTLGVYRPTLTNIARALMDKNIIQYHRGQLNILDCDALEQHSCKCHDNYSISGS